MAAIGMARDGRAVDARSTGRELLDARRRVRYVAILSRWVREHLPAGTHFVLDASRWLDEVIGSASAADDRRGSESALVWLRSRWLDASHPHATASARVEQLVGAHRTHVWDHALSMLSRRQRELVILRVEFGLDFDAIAAEMKLAPAYARAETVNALAALIDALGEPRRAA